MAGNLSDYIENELLDHLMNVGAYTAVTLYVALCDEALVDSDTGALGTKEVPNANGYARTATGAWEVAASGATQNVAAITFPGASGGSWGLVTHIAIVDSATYGAGNMIWHGPLTASKQVDDGDTFKINAGDLDLTLD
jgi:hypothetical protein